MTKQWHRYGIIAAACLAVIVLVWYRGRSGQSVRTEKKDAHTIGIIVRGETYRPGVDGFKKKMEELGYAEGQNVSYEIVFVEKREDLPGVVQKMLSHGVDLIHTYSTPATVEAYRQTKTTPIVFGSMGDPVASKTIHSLQSSGTNVTGVSSLSVPLVAKRLEFLVEAVPRVKKVAIPYTADDIPGKNSYIAATEAAAALGVTMVPYLISPERPVRETAAAILRRDVDGIVLSSDSATWANLDAYVAQAAKEGIPFSVFDKDMVVKGGLIGYGPDYFVTGGQSAVLADKIIRGEAATNIPVEIPQKFILAINLDTARAIGIIVPQTLLEKADLIIDSNK